MRRLSALSAFVLASCAHGSGLHLKVYDLDKDQGGLVRKQDKEVLPFEKALGFRCLSASDFDALLDVCFSK